MLKVALILGALAAVAASSIGLSRNAEVSVQVLTPQEMDEFLNQNPQAQPFNREVSSKESRVVRQTRNIITYTLGARQIGDRAVSYDYGRNTWSTPQDVTLTINYPAVGFAGAVITWMKIEVDQSNDSGRAYVTSGGIGYTYIGVIVESKATYWFDWVHNIYGI